MKPMKSQMSFKAIIFFLNLRRSVLRHHSSIHDFFNYEFLLSNPTQIAYAEFMKLIHWSQSKFEPIEITQIFNELKQGPTILKTILIDRYNQINAQYPVDKVKATQQQAHSRQPQTQMKQELENAERNRKKKMLLLGLQKLKIYAKQNGASELFDECDDENKGYLTKKEFNKFLIATDVRELTDKTIRYALIKKIFSYYPDAKMTLEKFLKLFQINIEDEKKRRQAELKAKEKPRQLNDDCLPEKPKPFKKKPMTDNVVENKPEKIRPMTHHQQNIKKESQNSENNSHDEILNVREIFPMAYRLYRLGLPSSQQELVFFETLQAFLHHKNVFVDKHNPVADKGKYVSASTIFNGPYFVFQMAASVLNREKSRIGLARQIEPKDIMQGQVGDCYFLSSIASIVSIYPEIISEKILFTENDAGFYAVRLFIDGEWQIFITDDQFPCRDNKPVYAKPHGKQIWVMLIEKCWAKSFGSYWKIDGGSSTEAFRALTGAFTEHVTIQNQKQKDQVYKKLQYAFQHKYVATAAGSDYLDSLSEQKQNELGLMSNHSYSFLKFINVNGQILIKMRNPWGSTVWTGVWSFQSPKWTKDLRDQYNYHNKPGDGAFYMPWNLFVKYFSSFVICRLDPTNFHSSLKIHPLPHKSKYVCINVKEQGSYGLAVYQQNKRRIGENYEYSPVRLVIATKTNGKYQYVASANNGGREVTEIETQLKPGLYYAAVKVQWQQQKRVCTLTTYGPDHVDLQEIKNSIAPSFKSGVVETYSEMRSGTKTSYSNISIPSASKQTYFNLSEGLGFLKLKNPSNKNFTSTFTFPQMKGMKPIKPARTPHTFQMKAGTESLVGYWLNGSGYSYSSSESMKY